MKKSTIQLLRFPFSYFLMPVYFFALSFVSEISLWNALLAFLLIHLLLYPASNGYNSYMDRDTESIGGIKNPMQPTRQLFYVTISMDISGILFSFFITWQFAAAFTFYMLCSRMYSYRGIRLKRFPVLGYLTVICNQGALVFAMVFYACEKNTLSNISYTGLIAAAFLIGGFYPVTQVYQHKADRNDDVYTISMLLGKRGTFIFCSIMYAIAFALLFVYYNSQNNLHSFLVLQIFFLPVLVYFLKWVIEVWKNEEAANFKNTMRMNILASTCTNLAFITLTIIKHIG